MSQKIYGSNKCGSRNLVPQKLIAAQLNSFCVDENRTLIVTYATVIHGDVRDTFAKRFVHKNAIAWSFQ